MRDKGLRLAPANAEAVLVAVKRFPRDACALMSGPLSLILLGVSGQRRSMKRINGRHSLASGPWGLPSRRLPLTLS